MSSTQRKANYSSMRLLGWISFLIGYLLVGALLFKLAEEDHGKRKRSELNSIEKSLRLQSNLSSDEYNLLRTVILKLDIYQSGEQWSFAGALYFAFTVITTIGYGHSVPQTKIGKFLCSFYAVGGIVLWQTNAQMFAERINKITAKFLRWVVKRRNQKFHIKKFHLIYAGLFLLSATILIGMPIFAYFEKWSYLESAYYCVMTLSTIGFGDYVALQNHGSLQADWFYVMFSFIYIIFGLTISGNLLNLIVLRCHPHGNGLRVKDRCRDVIDKYGQRRRARDRSSVDTKEWSDSEKINKETIIDGDSEFEVQINPIQHDNLNRIKEYFSRIFCCFREYHYNVQNEESGKMSLYFPRTDAGNGLPAYESNSCKEDSDVIIEVPTVELQENLNKYPHYSFNSNLRSGEDAYSSSHQSKKTEVSSNKIQQTCIFEKDEEKNCKSYVSELESIKNEESNDQIKEKQDYLSNQSRVIHPPPPFVNVTHYNQHEETKSEENQLMNDATSPFVPTFSKYQLQESFKRIDEDSGSFFTTVTSSQYKLDENSGDQGEIWKDEERLIKSPVKFLASNFMSRGRALSDSTYQNLPLSTKQSRQSCVTTKADTFFNFRDRNYSLTEGAGGNKYLYRNLVHSKSMK